jgi:hypothetical protein
MVALFGVSAAPLACYPAAVQRDGAVLQWRFAESTPVIFDESGHGQTGRWLGMASHETDGALARADDGAARFADDAYLLGDQDVAVGEGSSLETWVRVEGASGAGPLLSLDQGGDRSRTLQLTLEGQLRGLVSLGGGWPEGSLTGPVVPSVQSWHHVVFTVSGQELTLFMDGAAVGTREVAPPLPAFAARLHVAASAASWYGRFAGLLDEVALYPSALTPGQVAEHYALGTAPPALEGEGCCGDGDCAAGLCVQGVCSTQRANPYVLSCAAAAGEPVLLGAVALLWALTAGQSRWRGLRPPRSG